MPDNSVEVRKWLEKIREASSGCGGDFGVRVRGTHRTEVSRLVQELEQIVKQLVEEPLGVRREVVSAVSKEIDEVVVQFLSLLARYEPDWRIRQEIVAVLQEARGPMAVKALMDIAEKDPMEEVQVMAIRALGEIALCTDPNLAKKTRAFRVMGAFRIRGIVSSKNISPEAEAILSLLDKIRRYHLSSTVREEADRVLGNLDE